MFLQRLEAAQRQEAKELGMKEFLGKTVIDRFETSRGKFKFMCMPVVSSSHQTLGSKFVG